MKKLSKTLALVIALIMVLTATAAIADSAIIGTNGVVESGENTITLKKQLTAFNPGRGKVNAPSITYSYTIEPGSANKQITDENKVSVATTAGPTGATITASITWDAGTTADQLDVSTTGTANYKNITADFSDVTFSNAGVYRYKITETATYTNTGVVDGNDHVRYLDVYVKNSSTEGKREIYGYVLFAEDKAINGSDAATDADNVTAAKKTEGFVGDSADKYYTYNLEITKTLTGDNGMKNHKFPFTVTFTGNETDVLPMIEGTNADIPTWSAKGAISSFTADKTIKIADGGKVTITGIPIGTKVEIAETNDVAGTTYTVSSTGADTDAAAKAVATDQKSETATVSAQTAAGMAAKTVSFTNKLDLISPTGYVSRVAPYALLLIAGMALLFIAMKRRGEKEDE